jgi:hypothetical protein
LTNGQVLVAGGGISSFNAANSAELYDPASETWTTIILTNATLLPNGAFQFAFASASGTTNTVFCTTNVLSPTNNWPALGDATEVAPGQFQFADPQATNNPQRYYRVHSP